MTSHQAPIATPSTHDPSEAAHHSGHHEYGGKKPSSPAPSAISASLRSSGRGVHLGGVEAEVERHHRRQQRGHHQRGGAGRVTGDQPVRRR